MYIEQFLQKQQGKPIYQDVCYPVTKDFREKLYKEIISEYEKAKDFVKPGRQQPMHFVLLLISRRWIIHRKSRNIPLQRQYLLR